ncbi:CASP-like protein 4U1 [Miscanthus floridulus]|uniref:CASP-like protein 4U1 n=1 Tax=Miscanthus floridulus TaxID=154761 RepID=UPI00345817E4
MYYGRYGVGVNAFVCFYSIAQAFAEILRLVWPASMPRSTPSSIRQVLAYLLISASSAAASRNRLWALRHGEDQFDGKINIAVWFSFLGFLALSANALISMANLFSRI